MKHLEKEIRNNRRLGKEKEMEKRKWDKEIEKQRKKEEKIGAYHKEINSMKTAK